MGKKKKQKLKNRPKKKGLFFRILKRILIHVYKKTELVGLENLPTEPCIIVGNHAQMHGPILAEVKAPYKRYTWCIGNMLHLKEVPKYAFIDFWSHKPKWMHWFYKLMSYTIAPLCVYIFTNADTIGVYKDARGITTFKNTVKALKEGANIIIFPESCEEFNNIVNEFQDKFIDVARIYHKDTGKELSFVPMYNAPKIKKVVYGKPIKFNAGKSIDYNRMNICEYLKAEITRLAKELPEHTVIPYANISKKKYPKNK